MTRLASALIIALVAIRVVWEIAERRHTWWPRVTHLPMDGEET